MIIFAIDPGTRESGVIVYEVETKRLKAAKLSNESLLSKLINFNGLVVIEKLMMGRTCGAEVLETAIWTGRFMQVAKRFIRIPRTTILRYFNVLKKDGPYHEFNTTDARIRHLMIQKYGNIKLKKDEWQALALLTYYLENDKHGEINDQSFNR